MNKLYKTTAYLIGPIESEIDAGMSWRMYVKDKLDKIGIRCFDPCAKPFIKDLSETVDYQNCIKKLREDENYDELSIHMKEIRSYDLRLCDLATFAFCYIDGDKKTCGSWEEVFWMGGRLKKPVFFVYKQGKKNIPLWMYGVIPHKYFYNSIDDALNMIYDIDSGKREIDSDRWKLLNIKYL
jgi:hypothetical protein